MQVSVAAHRGRHILRRGALPGGELRAARAWSPSRRGERERRGGGSRGGPARGRPGDVPDVSGPQIGIGIVGYGMMGKAHAYGYAVAPLMRKLPYRPQVRVISGRDATRVAAAAAAYGIQSWVADWGELVRRPDVDVVDICTPPGTHAEIATAAAAAGKAVICQTPHSVSYAPAASARDALGSADGTH